MIMISKAFRNEGSTLQPEMPKGHLISTHLMRENMAKRRATKHHRITMFRARQERKPEGEENPQQLIPASSGNLRRVGF